MAEREPAGSPPGVLASVRSLAATGLGLVQTRLQLLANEVEEQGIHGLQLCALGAVAIFCAAAGVLLVTTWIIVAFWDNHRLLTVGLLAFAYFAAAAVALRTLKARAAARPKLFATSLAELERDRELLRP